MNGPPMSALGVVINGSSSGNGGGNGSGLSASCGTNGGNGGASVGGNSSVLDLEDFEPQPRDRCNTWPLQKPAGDLGHHTSPLIHEEIPEEEDCDTLEDIDIDGSCDNLSAVDGFIGLNTAIFQTGNSSGHGSSGNGSNNNNKKNSTARRNAWGNLSYADLITQAILSSTEKRLTLAQIYDWFLQNVPFFRDKGDSNSSAGWKNSIRHNLSLHSRFMRIQNEGAGKSSWWIINPEAKPGKSSRRRTGSMEQAVKVLAEKKRGRVKKKIDQIRASTGALDSMGAAVGSSLLSPSSADSTTDLYDSSNNLNFQLSAGDFRQRSDSNLSNYSVASTSTNNHSRLSPRIEEPFDDWDLGDNLRVLPHFNHHHHHPLNNPHHQHHHVTPLLNGCHHQQGTAGLDAGYPDDLVDNLSQSMNLSAAVVADQSQSSCCPNGPDLVLPRPPYPRQSQPSGSVPSSSSSNSASLQSYLANATAGSGGIGILNDQSQSRGRSGSGSGSESGCGAANDAPPPLTVKISPRHHVITPNNSNNSSINGGGNNGNNNPTNQQQPHQQHAPISPYGGSNSIAGGGGGAVTIKSEPPSYQELYPASSNTPRVNSLPNKLDSHQMRLSCGGNANPMLRDVLLQKVTPSGGAVAGGGDQPGPAYRLVRPPNHVTHHGALLNSSSRCSLHFLANRNLRQHLIGSNQQQQQNHHHQQQTQHQQNQGSSDNNINMGCSSNSAPSGLMPVTSSFFYPPISSFSVASVAAPTTMTSYSLPSLSLSAGCSAGTVTGTGIPAAAMMMHVNGVSVVGQLPMELSDIQYDHNYKSEIQCDIDQVIRHELRIAGGRLEFTDFPNVKY